MKTYDTVADAYDDLAVRLTHVARRHIYNKDYATDAVHDAFTKTCAHIEKHPDHKVSGFIIVRELMRACRRINKIGSMEVPTDFSAHVIADRFDNT